MGPSFSSHQKKRKRQKINRDSREKKKKPSCTSERGKKRKENIRSNCQKLGKEREAPSETDERKKKERGALPFLWHVPERRRYGGSRGGKSRKAELGLIRWKKKERAAMEKKRKQCTLPNYLCGKRGGGTQRGYSPQPKFIRGLEVTLSGKGKLKSSLTAARGGKR